MTEDGTLVRRCLAGNVDALREFVPELIVTHPCRPQDNLVLFEQLRAAFAAVPGVNERAAALSAEFRAALTRCRALPIRARPGRTPVLINDSLRFDLAGHLVLHPHRGPAATIDLATWLAEPDPSADP